MKNHALYDIETQILTLFHITPAKIHNTKSMNLIPYEENSWGETENAVRIQINSAITAYCTMAIVQKELGAQRSIY